MSQSDLTLDIDSSWKDVLQEEFQKPYFKQLINNVENEFKYKSIYPDRSLIFNAFNSTPFERVKVVILGQDPYHGAGQAMGLSFSVPGGFPTPPSLRNIYKELHRSSDSFLIPDHGDLSLWADQGVFLLNAVLTVESGKPRSHAGIGWESFTDAVIEKLSANRQGIVFLLWGNFARQKRELINAKKHLILESKHPSPLAGNAFQGNNHFADTNDYLVKNGEKPINWQV